MGNHRKGLVHDLPQGLCLGAPVAARRQPGLGIDAGQQQVIVARSLPQDAGRRKNARRFLDQDASAHVGRALQAQSKPQEKEPAAVVGQVVRRVVVAKIFEAGRNNRGVAGQYPQGFFAWARKATVAGVFDDVDGALGGRVGVPGWALVGGAMAFAPGAPQGIDPGRIGGGAKKRQPGEPVDGGPGFLFGEGAADQIARAAWNNAHRLARQRQIDGRLGPRR